MKRCAVVLIFALAYSVTACGGGGGGDTGSKEMVVEGIPGTVSRLAVEGQNPGGLGFTITNTGNDAMDYSITAMTSDGAAWLAAAPLSGTIAASGAADVSVTFDIVTPSLVPGTYTGSITVTGTTVTSGRPAQGSPVTISVNLTVTAAQAALSVDNTVIEQDIASLADTWSPLATFLAPYRRFDHTAVWTGYEMLVWGGRYPSNEVPEGEAPWEDYIYHNDGRVYDAAADVWSYILDHGLLVSGRSGHTAVWTGSKMIVWGGQDLSYIDSPSLPYGYDFILEVLDSGGAYDLAADSWSVISTVNVPIARSGHTAVWTGAEWIVCGGCAVLYNSGYCEPTGTGGIYHPDTDTWTTIPEREGRSGHTAVWTGSKMVVWGGRMWGETLNDGLMFDPADSIWTGIAWYQAPSPRDGHTAVWTGSKMIVWGGNQGDPGAPTPLDSGGLYDPASDSWSVMSTVGAPLPRLDHTAVWTGSRMVVFGGTDGGPGTEALSDGGIYDPATDTWAPITATGPSGRSGHTALWTGTGMLIFGGRTYAVAGSPGSETAVADGWIFE